VESPGSTVRHAGMRRLGVLLLLLSGCATTGAPNNTLTSDEIEEGWRLLFDGKSTYGWHNYGSDPARPVYGWRAVNGKLTRTDANAGDLVTNAEFENFELKLEWQVAKGGNSGIFIRATEDEPFIYMSAPEMQVLDDANHPDGQSPLTSAGSCFGLYPAPPGVVKPAGKWNEVRLRVDGTRVTHWLNGQRIVDYELGSSDWQARVAASKFAAWPRFAKARRGHIGLQDHGDRVAFRNIKILRLPDGK